MIRLESPVRDCTSESDQKSLVVLVSRNVPLESEGRSEKGSNSKAFQPQFVKPVALAIIHCDLQELVDHAH